MTSYLLKEPLFLVLSLSAFLMTVPYAKRAFL